MFQILGYNFFEDGDCLNNAPNQVDNITSTTIENAIYDHFNVTRDTTLTYTSTIPEWTYQTIMDCNFEDNINAGNVDFLIENISFIKIKRRVAGTFNWITLTNIPINTVEDLTFTFNDILNASGTEYEYAFVPVINNVEGNYIINSVLSQFNGIFVGDPTAIYRFLYDVNYGTNARNQKIGTFEPLGNKYPIVVANGLLSYDTGSVSATILNDNYEETGVLDPQAIVAKKDLIKDFLTNKKPKILKDWNGSSWLIFCASSPQVTYKSNSGMRIPNIAFDWTQVGDIDSQSDLYNNGLVSEPS